MAELFFLVALAGLLVLLGFWEYLTHSKNLKSIPIRLHVNGTRGKSSVTRLLVSALNEGGIRTVGKTTGTLPRVIFPNRKEYPVYRPAGHANVLEQLRIAKVARVHKAEAVVIECMALQPRLQWLSEEKLVQATHGVITNAREDHLDVMGPTERDVALALLGMVPRRKKLFTAESRNIDLFERVCRDRRTEMVRSTPEDAEALSHEDMAGFSYQEHPDNVALVLKVCASLSIDRETAIRGMHRTQPDEGALKSYEVHFFGRRLVFVNGFAANDPESTERVWRISLEEHRGVANTLAVFNCRNDRQERSLQLARAYAKWPQADAVLLMGTGTHIFAQEATRRGVDSTTFLYAEGATASQVFEIALARSGREALIVGMANIAGPGLQLVNYFRNRSLLPDPSDSPTDSTKSEVSTDPARS